MASGDWLSFGEAEGQTSKARGSTHSSAPLGQPVLEGIFYAAILDWTIDEWKSGNTPTTRPPALPGSPHADRQHRGIALATKRRRARDVAEGARAPPRAGVGNRTATRRNAGCDGARHFGGRRKYRYTFESFTALSSWLKDGKELGDWLDQQRATKKAKEDLQIQRAIADVTASFEKKVDETEKAGLSASTAEAAVDQYELGFQIVKADPETEEVPYTEWDITALDLVVVPPSCPNPKFPVNARAMHTYMQVGKFFANWIKDRIKKFQFIEDVDFVVFSKFGKNPKGGRPSEEYWLTGTTARMMAADVNSKRGVEVIKFLVARHERLEALVENAVADMAATDDGFIKFVDALPASSEVVADAETGELIPRQIDGFIIHQRAKDGYVNATAMCKAAGKDLYDYKRLDTTKEFLKELEGSPGIPGDPLMIVVNTGPNGLRGTWIHPDMAVNLAKWCSSKFAVQVSRWVRDWLTTGKVTTQPTGAAATRFTAR
jgi:phage anti-repressor protein